MSNYIHQLINTILSENTIDDIFDDFIDHVSNTSFDLDQELDYNFQLNQNVINNAYTLRRNLELQATQPTVAQQNITQPRIAISNIIQPSIIRSNIIQPSIIRSNITQPNITLSNITRSNIVHTNITSNRSFNINSNLNAISNEFFDNIFNTFSTFLDIQDLEGLENIEDLEDIKVTLTEDQFNKLNHTTLDELDIAGNCTICLEKRNTNDKLTKLKCNHIYHRNCIHEWLTKSSTKCCICRKDVRESLS